MSIKHAIKQSPLLLQAARSSRDGLRKWRGLATRPAMIRRHVKNHAKLKVIIGADDNLRPGWLSTDYSPHTPNVIYLDAMKRFPFDDDSVDYFHAEHMIEHIPLHGARLMLAETYRCLKRGGRIRIATPDLSRLVNLVASPNDPANAEYIAWSNRTFEAPGAPADLTNGVITLNRIMRDWGHVFLYDAATLTALLRQAGFVDCQSHEPGQSDDPELRGIESHGDRIGHQANRFETMVLEAAK